MSEALAKNTLYLTLALIGQKILAFVYVIIIARLLGVEGYGEYFLAIGFAVIFSGLVDLGITNVFVRDATQKPEERQHLFSISFTLKLLLIVVMLIVANVASQLLGYDDQRRLIIAVASLSFALESIHALIFAALRTIQKLQYEAVILVVGQVVQLVIGIFFLSFAKSPVLLALALLLGNIWNVIAAAWIARKKLGLKFTPAFEYPAVKRFLKIAAPFALAAIFVKIYSYADSVMISKMLPEEIAKTSLGYYGIAYKFTYAFQFLPLAFIAGLYPVFSDLYQKNNERMVALLLRAEWYMAVLSFPMVFGIWGIGDVMLQAIYGVKYIPAIPTLMILFPVLIFIFLDFPISALLNAVHRQNAKTTIMGFTVVLNFGLNLWLIPLMHERGAALAALISFIWMFLAGLYVIARTLPIAWTKLLTFYGRVLFSSLLMYGVILVVKPRLHWVVVVLLAALIYLGILFAVKGISLHDLRAFKELFKKKTAPTLES